MAITVIKKDINGVWVLKYCECHFVNCHCISLLNRISNKNTMIKMDSCGVVIYFYDWNTVCETDKRKGCHSREKMAKLLRFSNVAIFDNLF